MVENDFLQGPWVLGEQFSASDFYLFTIDRWLEGDGVDVKGFPRVVEHMQRVAAMPAVKRVLEIQAA
jgi:glutathione S-transferase